MKVCETRCIPSPDFGKRDEPDHGTVWRPCKVSCSCVMVFLRVGCRQLVATRALDLTDVGFFGRAFLASPWRNVVISSWVSKGPYVSPFFACSNDTARRASINRGWILTMVLKVIYLSVRLP